MRPIAADMPTQEVELVEQEVLGDDLLWGHVGHADEWQHLMHAPGSE